MSRFINKIILFALLAPTTALAAGNFGLDDAAKDTGLFKGTLPDVIRQIIAAILSIIGLVFVVLIVRGGLIWMTSVGNADKVKEAREIITNSVIGLVIVIAAYAIVKFVFDGLLAEGVIGDGGGVPDGPD